MDVISLEQPNEPKKNNRLVIILVVGGLLLALCLCCIALGIGYFVINGQSFMPTPTLVPTWTPIPTEKPLPTTTPLPTFVPAIPVSTPVAVYPLVEQFNNNTNGWSETVLSDDYGKISYIINGQYIWEVSAVKPVNYKTWPENTLMVSDFTLTVDALRQNGPENCSYGVVFRLKDSENFYYFGISDVGQYYVGRQVNGEWTTLIDWTDTPSIFSGQVNALKVEAVSDQFTFFINGDQVDLLIDDMLTSGVGGLSIELYDADDAATFVFDNFVMDTP